LLAVGYALNIIDATVDAHLFEYDVNEDITVSLRPNFNMLMAAGSNTMVPAAGLCFKINFK
jgi:hypothetical protein